MHFLGIEIGHGGTRAVVLDLESAVIRAEAWVPHDWIEGLPAGYREQKPAQWIDAVARAVRQCLAALKGEKSRGDPNSQAHEIYQELMCRQQYLVDIFHSAGFRLPN